MRKIKAGFTKKDIEFIIKRTKRKTKKQIKEEEAHIKQRIKEITEGISLLLDYFSPQEILEIRNMDIKNKDWFLSGCEEIHQILLEEHRPKGNFSNSKIGLLISKIVSLKILECNEIVFCKMVNKLREEDGICSLKEFLFNHKNEKFNDLISM